MKQVTALIGAEEVSVICGCSKSKAYLIIRQCNNELKKQGKITISGRVNKKYLMGKIGENIMCCS